MKVNLSWKLLLVALAGLAWTVRGLAVEPLAGILACRAVEDPAARLACFDREAAGLATTPAASASATASAPAAASPPVDSPEVAKANFGLSEGAVAKKEVAAGKRPADVKDIQAHITAVSTTGTGFSVFTLDNGQVWIEITPDGDLMAKPGDAVVLSRGVLNSYWLQNHNGRGAKVHRVL